MSSKSELKKLLSSGGAYTVEEYYSDAEAINSIGRIPFTDFFVAIGDEEVEFPESRPRGYCIKKATINLLLFCKANSHELLPTTIDTIYALIYTAKAKDIWTNMPNLLQAKVLSAEPEEGVTDKVFFVRIPVEITELIAQAP